MCQYIAHILRKISIAVSKTLQYSTSYFPNTLYCFNPLVLTNNINPGFLYLGIVYNASGNLQPDYLGKQKQLIKPELFTTQKNCKETQYGYIS